MCGLRHQGNMDKEFEASHQVKEYLPFGLLTLYFFWCWFSLVTFKRSSLPYLVWFRQHWKQLRCKLNTQRIYKEYTIIFVWFLICVVCGIDNTGTRDLKLAREWKTTYLLVSWLRILSVSKFALVTLGRASLPYSIWYIHLWKQLRFKLNT